MINEPLEPLEHILVLLSYSSLQEITQIKSQTLASLLDGTLSVSTSK